MVGPTKIINPHLGAAYVAVTVVLMAYSYLFDVVPILIFYILWLPFAFCLLRPSYAMLLALSFPILSIASVLSSDYPAISLYKGVEYLSMVICAMIMSRAVEGKTFVQGLSFGCCIVLLLTLASGHYTTDYFTGTRSLVGYFGSKNQVGFYAEIAIFSSLILLFSDEKKILSKIAYGLIPFFTGLICLYLSKSASSVLSISAVLVTIILMSLLLLIPEKLRLFGVLLSLLALATLGISFYAFDINPQNIVLELMGKDKTLTGRSNLWEDGLNIAWERPLIGHGYAAFWVPDQPQAEALWKEFLIFNKTGFHFHSVFIQTFVDLGIPGLFLITLLLTILCTKSLRLLLSNGMHAETIFLAGIAIMIAVRSFVEVDYLGPFGIGSLLFFYAFTRLENFSSKNRLSQEA